MTRAWNTQPNPWIWTLKLAAYGMLIGPVCSIGAALVFLVSPVGRPYVESVAPLYFPEGDPGLAAWVIRSFSGFVVFAALAYVHARRHRRPAPVA